MARIRKNPLFHLEGAKELDKALKRLSDRAAGFLLQEAAEAGAEVIADEVRARAPVGDEPSPAGEEYGKLIDNITVKPDGRQKIGRARYGIGVGRSFWALWYELGNSRQVARPFMRPAFDAKKEEAVEAAGNVLRRLLRERGKLP